MKSGNGHAPLLTFTRPPRRVVSLVPSMTGSLYDLGAGEALVGITDYCQPPEGAPAVERVGGTKSPRVADVIRLEPELVIANQEENTAADVEAMEAAGLKVWVTFPRSVENSLSVLWVLVRLFQIQAAAPKVKTIEVTLEWTARAAVMRPPVRVFCPIWKAETQDGTMWWMTFNQETYAHDLLRVCGGANVFGLRTRQYPLSADLGEKPAEAPGTRDTRYPRVSLEEVRAADPEVILLPSEPYAFEGSDADQVRQELSGTAAVRRDRVHLIDGSLVTWHGTRLARSLVELPPLLEAVPEHGTPTA